MIETQSEVQQPAGTIPVHSIILWISLIVGLAAVTGLSAFKDWWLTGEEPNGWFYVFVPLVDTFGTAVVMTLFSRLFRQKATFLEFLAVTFGVGILMQTAEIITKLVYYKIWEYPGWLYLVIIFPLGFVLTTIALVRFIKLKPGIALLIAGLGFIGSLVLGITFTEITGLETPGS